MDALPEPLFLFPQGNTDSEFAFALFLSHVRDPLRKEEFSYKELKEAMLKTIHDLNTWSKEAGIVQVRTCTWKKGGLMGPAAPYELLCVRRQEHRLYALCVKQDRRSRKSGTHAN